MKITTLIFISTLAISSAAFAQTQNDEAVKSDVGAMDKDNAALQKDNDTIARDRAQKAADQANGNTGGEIVDSVKLGAAQTAHGEKSAEKGVDNQILQHDKSNMSDDSSK